MLKVKKIVGELLSSNSYLLYEEGQTDFFLIDVGDVKTVLNELPASSVIKGVFITHTHFDHINGLNEIVDKFPDCIVYTSEFGAKALYDSKLNLSVYHDMPFVFNGMRVNILSDNDSVQVANNCWLKAVATPGHCPSCLCYYTDEYVFTGDSCIPGVAVVSKLPRGNKRQAIESLDRILNIASNKMIYAGHDVDKWMSVL